MYAIRSYYVAAGKLPAALTALQNGSTDALTAGEAGFLEKTAEQLTQAKRPVLVGAVDP